MAKIGLLLSLILFVALPATAKIERFIKVDGGFYRGGQPTTYNDYVKLKNKGIKTVINLRANPEVSKREKKIVESLGMKYVYVPYSTFSFPSHDEITYLMGLLKNEDIRPVFLHCLHGKDRTGVVGILYRVQVQGWPVQKAYDEALALNIRWYIPLIPELIYRETGYRPTVFSYGNISRIIQQTQTPLRNSGAL